MALLDFDGFDAETNANLSNWWTFGMGFGISGVGTAPFSYGRSAQTPYYSGRTIAPKQTIFIQGHLRQNNIGNNNTQGVWGFRDAGSDQVSFNFTADLRVYFIVGATVVATTVLPVIAQSAWYFFQFRAHIANAGGTLELWINGTSVLSFTGDTQQTANATVNQWYVSNSNNNTWSDNILVYDTLGNAPNARTPETRIYYDLPIGAGAATGFTPSAGANWQNVDENPNDGDTTYNSAAAAVTDDLYAYNAATIPATTIVYAVANEYDVRKDDAGTNDVDALCYSGAVTYPKGEVRTLTTTWQRFKSFWDLDPATGAVWTVANANASQVGIRRTA